MSLQSSNPRVACLIVRLLPQFAWINQSSAHRIHILCLLLLRHGASSQWSIKSFTYDRALLARESPEWEGCTEVSHYDFSSKLNWEDVINHLRRIPARQPRKCCKPLHVGPVNTPMQQQSRDSRREFRTIPFIPDGRLMCVSKWRTHSEHGESTSSLCAGDDVL